MGFLVWIRNILGSVGGAYVLLLYFFQEKVVYVPVVPGVSREYPYTPSRFGLEYEDVELESSEDVKLHAWLCRPRHSPNLRGPTIIFFQENAGNIAHRCQNVQYMVRQLEANVFILSYRGYGKSTGTPSEPGIKHDAQVALDYVCSRTDLDPERICVFGRSLGGAVAAYTAASNPGKIRACVLENTFISIPAMAPCMFPLLGLLLGHKPRPMNWMVRSPWKNIEQVGKIDMPTLYLGAGQDEMVPAAHMDALWEARSPNPGNQREVFPNGRHMDMYQTEPQYWLVFKDFLAKNGFYSER